jgi:hypothetical protein
LRDVFGFAVFHDGLDEGFFGGGLNFCVHRCFDDEILLRCADQIFEAVNDPVGIIFRCGAAGWFFGRDGRDLGVTLGLFFLDIAGIDHGIEHDVCAFFGQAGIVER